MSTQPNARENSIEEYLSRQVKALGGCCPKWVSPGHNGVPDRILILPGGRIAFAETKRPKGGRASALQVIWQQILRRLGFICEFVRTKDEADALLYRVMMGGSDAL